MVFFLIKKVDCSNKKGGDFSYIMEALISILKEQVKEYEDLLNLAKQKQAALINNEIQVLDNITKSEHKAIIGATKLENKRLETIKELTEFLQSDVRDCNLKEITEKAPEPFQEQFSDVYQELTDVIDELHKINRENSSLIEQALKIVNFTISTITQSEREVIYPEKDSKNIKPVSRIFDSKA